jgi:hypothetical protein
MANSNLRLVAPTFEKRTLTPKRAKNRDLRTREYLAEHEIEMLMAAARQNRNGDRNASMILIAFRHGLRAGGSIGGSRCNGARDSCCDRPHEP